MKMKSLLFALIVSVQLAATEGDRCSECFATYEAAKNAAGNDTVKCNALRDVLTCLVNATASTCTLEASQSATIGKDFDTFEECWLLKPCNCQKDFWERDQTGGDGAVCTAALLYYDCLDGKAEEACDGTSTSADLLPFAQATIEGIASCDRITKTCDVCTTEYEKDEDDADTPAEKCSVLKTYLTCMESAAFCPLTTTKAAAIGTNYDAIQAECPLTDVCACQKNYWKTDVTSDSKTSCTAVATLKTCLEGVTSTTETGCDEKTVAADIKTYEKTNVKDIECTDSGNSNGNSSNGDGNSGNSGGNSGNNSDGNSGNSNGNSGPRAEVSILVSLLMLVTCILIISP